MELRDYLNIMVKCDGSDLFLIGDALPSVKVKGQMRPIAQEALPGWRIKELAYSIMSDAQKKAYEEQPEVNLSLDDQGTGRFRVNVFQQRGDAAMVIRNIKTVIPTPEELGLPPILKELIMQKRGLVLFVGATGQGKTTSLASLIDYRNTHHAGHIITVEDPIEFLHTHKKSIVTQREVGIDTPSFEEALVNTLRQAPEVILIGETRGPQTMRYTLSFAETGHLCLSTLNANNSNQALDRIIHFFPEEYRAQVLMDLSLNMVAIVSQRLITTKDNVRKPIFEILLGTPLAKDLIRKGDVEGLKEAMEKSSHLGAQTFDTALTNLYESGEITAEEAIQNADSQNNVRLAISLKEGKIGKNANNLAIEK